MPSPKPGKQDGISIGIYVEKPKWLTEREGIPETVNEGVTIIIDDCHRTASPDTPTALQTSLICEAFYLPFGEMKDSLRMIRLLS
jgi:hypothetical protein